MKNQDFKWKETYTYIIIAAVIVLAAIIGFAVRAHRSALKNIDSNTIGYQDNFTNQPDSEEEGETAYQTEAVEEDPENWEEDSESWEENSENWEEDGEEDSGSWVEEETDFGDPNETLDTNDGEEMKENTDNVEEENYILPGSDSRYISKSELEALSADQIRLARNELYARHGRIFQDESLSTYFNSLDWYEPTIEGDDFEESMLNEYELANRDLIVAYEEEMGY